LDLSRTPPRSTNSRRNFGRPSTAIVNVIKLVDGVALIPDGYTWQRN